MALLYAMKFLAQSTDETKPHVLGYNTPRVAANSLLLDVWNDAVGTARMFAVDLNGKMYSAALTAGDMLYAVAGGVSNVQRLDSLAIGAANAVLTSSGTAPQWSTGLTLASLAIAGGSASPALTVTTTGATTASVRYDGSNRLDISVSGAGAVTFDAVGGSAGFTFADAVTVSGALTATTISGTGLAIITDGSLRLNTSGATTTSLIMQLAGVTKGVVGVPATSGDIIATSAVGDLAIRTASGLILFSANGGTTVAMSIAASGAVTHGAATVSGLLTANAGVTVASGQTLTLTGATVTGLTAASVGAGTYPAGAHVFAGALSGITTLATTSTITVGGTVVTIAGGFGSAYALSPTGDSDTGIVFGAANSISLDAGGSLGLTCENGNIGLVTAPGFNAGSGTTVVFIPNRTLAPSGTPVGGGVLSVVAGALHWKGSSGTDTTLAPA